MTWPPAPIADEDEPPAERTRPWRQFTRWVALDCAIGVVVGTVIGCLQIYLYLVVGSQGATWGFMPEVVAAALAAEGYAVFQKYKWMGVRISIGGVISFGLATLALMGT